MRKVLGLLLLMAAASYADESAQKLVVKVGGI